MAADLSLAEFPAMDADELSRFVVKVLDAAVANVFPSEAEVERLAPHVDAIRTLYTETRGASFSDAWLAARARFVAQAIETSARGAEATAVRRVRSMISSALVPDGSDAETLRRLLLAALDPRLEAASNAISGGRE